ncbi:hypothetical protein GLW08_10715 [Pontibacillus yanchengensis]|uniref:Uncharacterized protein n=2 Tax=Pontibacillus yanchengensis TaxID=462910 RepID=A0ACC7VGA9_9BACI|nr:hypothetical protein [Pontibacillus yanchengensis]MYL34340.1 hypothetical protein [Pontibacillus yanchengensis]MYL53808.1 hypothetical protein [Pontibacillus yanchengensis]
MATIVKENDPVIKNVAGIANALKVPAEKLDVTKGADNLYLSLQQNGEEKLFPFTYNEEKNDYRVLQIPLSFSEEDIQNGKIVQKD